MKTEKQEPLARVTMRLPQSLWTAVQHRAVDENITLAELAARALRDYLKKRGQKEKHGQKETDLKFTRETDLKVTRFGIPVKGGRP